MKKLLSLILILTFNTLLIAQNKQLVPKFEERIELLSVVFRLAEAPEYMNNSIKLYSNSVDSYFENYKKHKVVQLAKKLRKKNGVSFDAVISMAIHIKIDRDSVHFNNLLIKNTLDKRWGNSAEAFITQLDNFYRQSQFKSFYMQHQSLYAIAIKRFEKIAKSVNIKWFENFFGYTPNGKYHIVLSFLNRGNYGPKASSKSGEENIYSILCAWKSDSLGYPIFNKNKKETLVHEFCHSFCNQLGDKYYPEMEAKALDFYKLVSKKMNRQAYGSARTMIYEILVRASTIKYSEDDGASQAEINKMLNIQKANGFLWIEKLYENLNKYASERNKYETLDDFMPYIVRLQNLMSPEKYMMDYSESCPHILSSSIENGASNISPDLKEIIIEYDRSMASYGISDKGNKPNMELEWKNKERTVLCIHVDLEPNTKYLLHFHPPFNVDQYGYPLKEGLELVFTTQK